MPTNPDVTVTEPAVCAGRSRAGRGKPDPGTGSRGRSARVGTSGPGPATRSSRWNAGTGRPASVTILALAAVTAGCHLGTDVACTALAVSGLQVEVRDSVTLIPAGRGATVTAQDGSYQETLFFLGAITAFDSLTFSGAVERTGTYALRVTKAGYRTWTRAGVVVDRDECHVIPAHVDVRLQPGSDPAPGT